MQISFQPYVNLLGVGQAGFVHNTYRVLSPGHCFPSDEGGGLLQYLRFVSVPIPHVTLHGSLVNQWLQTPSTATIQPFACRTSTLCRDAVKTRNTTKVSTALWLVT